MNARNTLQVGGITPLTTIDYPGELAAVVFCQGCPWRCRYCHNGHLLERAGQGVLAWPEVLEWLERRKGLLDAVVFSGGEPTLQRGLPEAINAVRSLGFKVGMHTAGCYPERLARLLPSLDWVGLDIKALPEDYPGVTGVAGSGSRAWQSLQYLIDAGVTHEIRVTVHDSLLPRERLIRLLDRLEEHGTPKIMLQPCRGPNMLDPALGDGTASGRLAGRCDAAAWRSGCGL